MEEVGASDNIEALFVDSDDDDVVAPAMMNEQVALMASFQMAHRKERTRQFMVAEQEDLAAMLVVRTNAAKRWRAWLRRRRRRWIWLPGRRRLLRRRRLTRRLVWWHKQRSWWRRWLTRRLVGPLEAVLPIYLSARTCSDNGWSFGLARWRWP
jgi:hypothetical protein